MGACQHPFVQDRVTRERQADRSEAERAAEGEGLPVPSSEASETLRSFYNSAAVMMGTVEVTEDDILHVSDNQATAAFFGTSIRAMPGRTARQMGVPERYILMWLEAYRQSVLTKGPVRFDYEHEGKGWLKVTVGYIGLSGGRERFSYVADDISDRKNAERALREAHDQLDARVRERTAELEQAKTELEAANLRLRHDAYYDALTGLPNRLFFTDRLQGALDRYRSDPDSGFTVLLLDLDHFKVVNDSLGHAVGDALLVRVGERLLECLPDANTVARFSGDEFTVLLGHGDRARATEAVERVQEALSRPLHVGERTFRVTASVGVFLYEANYRRPQEVLRDADLAMYHAKVHHSGRYEVFDRSMREAALRRLELEADLRTALEGRTLDLHFQPIVRLESRRLTGFEALVRWQHPRYGPLTPDTFIPVAEETGLVIELDRYVLERGCSQLASWRLQFPNHELGLNVNFSSQQFLRPDLVEHLTTTLRQFKLSSRQLNVEITESLLMQPAEAVDEAVRQLVARGVGLCIDDFGTGYASLSYLRRFPAHILKIDRSFVQGLSAGEQDPLVAAIITMAQALGMRVVAEGVETEEQQLRLRALGCEYGQGFLFAKPLSAEQATALLAAV